MRRLSLFAFVVLMTTSLLSAGEAVTPASHLVAAWDFEAGKGGPLADKAPAGGTADALKLLGHAKVEGGVAVIGPREGSALRAESSADLEQAGELTIWVRLRLDRGPEGFVSLVDKRRFRDPEERSYAFFVPPAMGSPKTYTVGGQISLNGSREASAIYVKGRESIPAGQWCEAAMVVERSPDRYLTMRWYAASAAEPKAAGDFALVGGPASNPAVAAIFRSRQPLLVGNDAALRPNPSLLELDEVRIYGRALTTEELAAIVPGELSK